MVDRFDVIYNTQRPHQRLPGRITPRQSWDATTAAAEAPRPKPIPALEANTPVPVVLSFAEPAADTGTAAQDHSTTACLETGTGLETSALEKSPAAFLSQQPSVVRSHGSIPTASSISTEPYSP